jgi:hypothetical protein
MLQSGELRNEKRMAYLTGVCCGERGEGSPAWCAHYPTTLLSLTLFSSSVLLFHDPSLLFDADTGLAMIWQS